MSTNLAATPREPVFPLRTVIATWWPLALSWLIMSLEVPMLSAVIARLANPTINLAAFGSVANPLIGIVQAPILTLLSLSTAVSRDWDSYLKGRRIMLLTASGLTLVYLAVSFTPLYDLIVRQLIGAPEEIIEPARLAMWIGVPWTFAVAFRRFNQGVMIRFNHSRTITIGTLIRFSADIILLSIAWLLQTIPGAAVGSLMMVVGVVTEAVYAGLVVRPVLRNEVRTAEPAGDNSTLGQMWFFFLPMMLTPLLNMFIRPIGSAALSRFPDPLQALAIWPVINSFFWLVVTSGTAFNEVVIALLDRTGARRTLLRFMILLSASQLAVMLLLALTPLAYLWFVKAAGLTATDSLLASRAFLIMLPSSILSPLNSWFVGNLLQMRRSRAITEGTIAYLLVFTIGLALGGRFLPWSGLFIVMTISTLAGIVQTLWLGLRAGWFPLQDPRSPAIV